MNRLKNKKILLIMPFFYHYEDAIRAHLERAGAEVWLVDTNIHAYGLGKKLVMFYTKALRDRLVYRYYEHALRDVPDTLDEVMIIKGTWMTDEVLHALQARFASADFRIYHWDSVATFPDQLRINRFFTKIYTFDPVDAAQYGWIYRPTFFEEEICHPSEEKRYDFLLICSMHTRRMEVLRKLKALAEKQQKALYSYIYVPRLQYIRETLLRHNPLYEGARDALHFQPLPQAETYALYPHTRCIVDYTFPQQNGFSMRTYDAMGCRCKLLTNNPHVKDADFYDPQNIYVYDPDHFEIPADFLDTPYRPLPAEIYDRYRLDGFLQELFG